MLTTPGAAAHERADLVHELGGLVLLESACHTPLHAFEPMPCKGVQLNASAPTPKKNMQGAVVEQDTNSCARYARVQGRTLDVVVASERRNGALRLAQARDGPLAADVCTRTHDKGAHLHVSSGGSLFPCSPCVAAQAEGGRAKALLVTEPTEVLAHDIVK